MDKYGVPKAINRNVIKAIYELKSQGFDYPKLSDICSLVDLQMDPDLPSSYLCNVVKKSLENMSQLGIVEKNKTKYHIKNIGGDQDRLPPPIPNNKKVDKKIFKKAVKNENDSKLNPNKRKRVTLSDDSINANEPANPIKRLRTSKMLLRKGAKVELPKARTANKLCDDMEHEPLGSSSDVIILENDQEQKLAVNPELQFQIDFENTHITEEFDQEIINDNNQGDSNNNNNQPTNDSSTQTYESKSNHSKEEQLESNNPDVTESQLNDKVETPSTSERNQTTSKEQKSKNGENTQKATTVHKCKYCSLSEAEK